MGLGDASTIVASNITQVVLCVVTILRFMRLQAMPRDRLSVALLLAVLAWVAIVLVALANQDLFYIAARMLKAQGGANLWEMHPAPALVSLILNLAIYSLSPPYFRALGKPTRWVARRCALELFALTVFYFALRSWLA